MQHPFSIHIQKDNSIFRVRRLIELEIISLLGDCLNTIIFVEIMQLYIVAISARAALKRTTHDQISVSASQAPKFGACCSIDRAINFRPKMRHIL